MLLHLLVSCTVSVYPRAIFTVRALSDGGWKNISEKKSGCQATQSKWEAVDVRR